VQGRRLGYIGIGGNLGDRRLHLAHALELLAHVPGLEVLRSSRIYESPAWGYASEHAFLNAVAEISWRFTPQQLLNECRRIEQTCGRQRKEDEALPASEPAYADRIIDLDILWLKGVELLTPQLTLPHPQAQRRAFVLVPWCELAPELILHGQSLCSWLALLPREEVASITPVSE
jgi:2-amino-4-hydroxy-6-hydroxymethyldihydropteridine diphosphokinase